MRSFVRFLVALALVAMVCPQAARASYHLMQIEQIIGGVNGDVTAQAIQLRMRAVGQNFLSPSRLIAWDANGMNPVIIFDFTGSVPSGALGSRVLLCTPSFVGQTTPACVPNYTMTNPIPASYLAAGKLTFSNDTGTILWSVAWGGYAGPNTGLMTNDPDGQFSPAFALPLPSTSTSALRFPGLATAMSTNNAADYVITPGAATFTNNANASFNLTVVPTGQCCLAGGTCQVTTLVACSGMAGTWTEGGACGVGDCGADPMGACCMGSMCSVSTLFSCGLMGGTFMGEGSTCFEGDPANFLACCPANFDEINGVGVPDIFAFLAAWFANDAHADFNGIDGIGVPDIFAFLAAWFAGCS